MEQNKVRTYILYAIGEIALVMIGILLALQVNNWNERVQLKQEEQRYIMELINDLEQDSVALNAMREEAILIGRSKSILVSYLDNPDQVPDSLALHQQRQWISIQKFTPITVTIDEIKSGIGFGVIRDNELRRTIVSQYNDYDQWQVEDEVFQKSLDVFFRLSKEHLSNVNAPREQELIEWFRIPEVSNTVRTNYANSRLSAIESVLKSNNMLRDRLRKYQEVL